MKTKLVSLVIAVFAALNAISQTSTIIKQYVEDEWGCQILVCYQENNVRALYAGRIGSNDFKTYLTGNMNKNIISGTSITEGYFYAGPGTEEESYSDGTFKIETDDLRSILKLFEDNSTEPIEFHSIGPSWNFSGNKNLRGEPSPNGKLLSKFDLADSQVKLLRIGDVQKIGKTTDFWYMVKVNDIEGWIFGGLFLQ